MKKLTYKTDTEFVTNFIKNIKLLDQDINTLDIGMNNGWHFLIDKTLSEYTPKIGDEIKLYGKGIGYNVRGVVINNHLFYYKTPEEEIEEFKEDLRNLEEERKANYLKNKTQIDEDIEKMSKPFKDRIKRLQIRKDNKSPWDWEPYEVFILTQADEFVKYLKTIENVNKFVNLSWEEQKKLVPTLSDGHSNNTFGHTCNLAIEVIKGNKI